MVADTYKDVHANISTLFTAVQFVYSQNTLKLDEIIVICPKHRVQYKKI